MNPRTMKEARQLFWPWAVVTGAAVMALVAPWEWQPTWLPAHVAEATLALVAFIGFPLLAGLPMGYEFQYRTFPSLLAAPLDRRRIWREKSLVTLAVVLAPAILCALRGRENQVGVAFASLVGAWIVALTAAAMFWTLLAKSTMGGLALNVGTQVLLFMGWMYAESRPSLHNYFSAGAAAAAVLCYAGAMVWLGRRALLKFQAVDGLAATDPLSALASRAVPRRAAEWFRCRPTGMILNLLRRELHLLRPVWPLAAANVLAWICLFALGPDHAAGLSLRNPADSLILAAIVATAVLTPLIAILAGTLSLGEEKNFGTHGWHMTLPASVRLQWSVKLAVALLAGTLFAGALPPLAIAARSALVGGPSLMSRPGLLWWVWPFIFAAVTLASFWLSTVVKGTVRAALWVFPALFLFGAAYSLALESGYRFASWAQTLTDHMLLWLDPFRLIYLPYPMLPFWQLWRPDLIYVGLPILVAAVPVALFILAQSYRRFRGRAEDTNRRLAKNLLLAAAVFFVCGTALGEFAGLIRRSQMQVFHFVRETNAAVLKLEEANPVEAGSKPVRLTVAQLEQAAPMSEFTRHWLDKGTITVSPAPADWEATEKLLGRYRFGYWSHQLKAEQASLSFVASMQLSNGMTCRILYRYKSHTLPQGAELALSVFGCQ
jgi:ABC-2 family transporter protein